MFVFLQKAMTSKALYSVPDTALQRLRCALCSDYLSQFPVHVCKEIGSVCGRCPVLHDENPVRNEAYEIIASSLSFPCRFSGLGCLELLTPRDLVEHEETCTFRQYFCPFMPSGCCPWQGPSGELLGHFLEKHRVFILDENLFEIDFTSKYSENYLLCDNSNLFVLHKKCDVNENLFWCAVSFIGAKSIADQYNFQLILSVKGNNEDSYAISPAPVRCFTNPNIDKSNAVEIDASFIMKELDDPANIICRVTIVKKQLEPQNRNSQKRMVSIDSIEEDILNDLECPICLEFMVPPIYQCEVGHSVCSICKFKVNECPTCKQSIRETRNFHLERITNRIKYYCKYRDFDCSFISSAKDIKQHEADCKFGPYKCPLHDYIACNWKGKVADIMQHIRQSHHDNMLELDLVSIPYEESGFDDLDEDCYIVESAGEIFKVICKCENDCLNYSVQLVGPADEAKKFMFVLDFVDDTNRNQRLCLKRYCAPLSLNCDAFNTDDDFVKIPIYLVNDMIDSSFTYRIQITGA